LSYLNNLAYAHGMRPRYQFGFYVGTFGPCSLIVSEKIKCVCEKNSLVGIVFRKVQSAQKAPKAKRRTRRSP